MVRTAAMCVAALCAGAMLAEASGGARSQAKPAAKAAEHAPAAKPAEPAKGGGKAGDHAAPASNVAVGHAKPKPGIVRPAALRKTEAPARDEAPAPAAPAAPPAREEDLSAVAARVKAAVARVPTPASTSTPGHVSARARRTGTPASAASHVPSALPAAPSYARRVTLTWDPPVERWQVTWPELDDRISVTWLPTDQQAASSTH